MKENLSVDDGFRGGDGYIWMLNRAKCVVGDDLPTADSPSADGNGRRIAQYGCRPFLGEQNREIALAKEPIVETIENADSPSSVPHRYRDHVSASG